MINQQLINPKSIVVVGASNDIHKPGGKILKNLIDNNFKGKLYATNLKEDNVQGIKSYRNIKDLPNVDLAIIAIAAKFCPQTVDILTKEKNTRAFIILSAGFSEENKQGAELEKQVVKSINAVDGCLIGPNCIGVLNQNYTGVFTTPIPKLDPKGCDFISGSGATAVFIMESGIPNGLTFSSVYSVGNSAQLGVEEILKYMDQSFDPEKSSKVKLLYIESISKPKMLFKHARSLIKKGCKIAAIKAGGSEAGSKAASSHTGAMASSDLAVETLFRKAGIVRCYGRRELTTVASIYMHKDIKGKNIAIITHAGGPAVMLTDVLSDNGMNIPHIESPELLEKLFPGSSVANPIDFLATGTAEQLATIIDFCENKFENIDAMAVIFGSPGLFNVYDVYDVLDEKMKTCKKPIYPILPSLINAKDEINYFIAKARINFPDEVVFGKALTKIYNTPKPALEDIKLPEIDKPKIRAIIDNAKQGYISPAEIQGLLDAVKIPRVGEAVVKTRQQAIKEANILGLPVVMKVVGPVHKSDVNGVVVNVNDDETVGKEFDRMMKIKDTTSIMLQPMLSGTELFAGAKYEPKFGHIILCGLGGIFIEVFKDISSGLVPVSKQEALAMIKQLKAYKIIKGVRGQQGIDENVFADIITRLSALLMTAPEIIELDINPLLGKKDKIIAVESNVNVSKISDINSTFSDY